MSIAEKRNLSVKYSSNNIIVHVDDDDYYPINSIYARVKTLITNKGIECVGCDNFGIYDIIENSSFLMKSNYLSEASMCYYKSFHTLKNFSTHPFGEGVPFLKNRRNKVLSIPFDFVIIAITHNKNYTGNNRTAIEKLSNKIFTSWDFDTQQFMIKLYKKLVKANPSINQQKLLLSLS